MTTAGTRRHDTVHPAASRVGSRRAFIERLEIRASAFGGWTTVSEHAALQPTRATHSTSLHQHGASCNETSSALWLRPACSPPMPRQVARSPVGAELFSCTKGSVADATQSNAPFAISPSREPGPVCVGMGERLHAPTLTHKRQDWILQPGPCNRRMAPFKPARHWRGLYTRQECPAGAML